MTSANLSCDVQTRSFRLFLTVYQFGDKHTFEEACGSVYFGERFYLDKGSVEAATSFTLHKSLKSTLEKAF